MYRYIPTLISSLDVVVNALCLSLHYMCVLIESWWVGFMWALAAGEQLAPVQLPTTKRVEQSGGTTP